MDTESVLNSKTDELRPEELDGLIDCSFAEPIYNVEVREVLRGVHMTEYISVARERSKLGKLERTFLRHTGEHRLLYPCTDEFQGYI